MTHDACHVLHDSNQCSEASYRPNHELQACPRPACVCSSAGYTAVARLKASTCSHATFCGGMARALLQIHFSRLNRSDMVILVQNRAQAAGPHVFISISNRRSLPVHSTHDKTCQQKTDNCPKIRIRCCRRPAGVERETCLPVKERLLHQAGWHHELHLIFPGISAAGPERQKVTTVSVARSRLACCPVVSCTVGGSSSRTL